MSPGLILTVFLFYTLLIFFIGWFTSRKANNESFFIGNRVSPWYVVAYGMIGASLSGVTFISIPGDVGSTQWSYMVIVFGYLIGYFVIARVLLPLYYRLKLTSIYTYLEDRFGFWSYKTGAFYFLLSRIIGASFRMFLVVNVLQFFVFDAWNIPFWATTAIFIILILLYTFKGGIKTIVWTDTLQTTFMLIAVVISVVLISKELGQSPGQLFNKLIDSSYSKMFFFDDFLNNGKHFFKMFLTGVFMPIVMTGLDQDMMQKNLSCRNLKDAQKNMYWMSSLLVPVNFLFLVLGGFLYLFAASKGIATPSDTDLLFPLIAIKHLGAFAGIVFMIGLIAAAYSSADSALTALTTSFSIDFLNLKKRDDFSEKRKSAIRKRVHIGLAAVLLMVIVVFSLVKERSVIDNLFRVAGYTYGPLLGLYAFGLFTKRNVRDIYVPVIAILSPVVCYVLNLISPGLIGYTFGFELLILNGLLTFIGLLLISGKQDS